MYWLLLLQVAAGKIMEQGPVLVISFQSQQILVARNPKGDVVEGDPVSGSLTFCRLMDSSILYG